MSKKCFVHVYTGNGGGKTVTSLGLTLRSVAHNHKVVMIQFLKGRQEVGAYLIKDRLSPNYEIHQFGTEELVDLNDPSPKDKALARKGFELAKEKALEKPNLLILDEINIAMASGLIDVDEVLRFLDEVPSSVYVVLTGRYAPEKIKTRADIITLVEDIKNSDKRFPAREGIAY